MQQQTIYDCNTSSVYKVAGDQVHCDKCGETFNNVEFTIRCTTNQRRIVGPDKIGRLYRECRYVSRPDTICRCEKTVWLASDMVIIEAE